jgi:hypothetical protein
MNGEKQMSFFLAGRQAISPLFLLISHTIVYFISTEGEGETSYHDTNEKYFTFADKDYQVALH